MPDLDVISWNIKDFNDTCYTRHCNIIQRQLYNGAAQLCDLFVIIEPKIATQTGTLGQVVTGGVGYNAMLQLYDWLYAKSTNWKMVPPLESSNDTKADCVAVYYDSSKVELEGPDLNRLCLAPRPATPPWQNVHPGQVRHCDRNGTMLNFQGRRPYLVKFRDATAAAQTTSQAMTLTIKPAVPVPIVAPLSLTITSPTTLPAATLSQPYGSTLTSGGGTGTVQWKLKSGSTLPSGLTLNAGTGVLQGTLTAAGSFTFDIEATDALSASASTSCMLDVKTVTITSAATLPSASPNSYYQFKPQTECVHGATTWSVATGALPSGLGLDTANGTISGDVGATAKTESFQLEVVDSNTVSHTQNCTITVTSALTITTTQVPEGTQGVLYQAQLNAIGGYRPTAWSTTSTLPDGLTLSRSGVIEGTPTAHGTFHLVLQATCYPGFFLVAIHAPPQTYKKAKNYVKDAHILAVKKLIDLRETTTERLQTRSLLVGDYNVCDQPCCNAKGDLQAFTALNTTYLRHAPAAPRSSLAVFHGGNASNALKANWKRNAFDHVYTKGFAATDVTALKVEDLVTTHPTHVTSVTTATALTQTDWNAIFREVIWSAGVSDHLPVKFTLTI